MTEWKFADAKDSFSEVVLLALTRGPQRVNLRKDAVIVLSLEEFELLEGKAPTEMEYLAEDASFEGPDLKPVSEIKAMKTTAKKATSKKKKPSSASKTKRTKKKKVDYDKLIQPGSVLARGGGMVPTVRLGRNASESIS
jgi:hypothetical protein